MIRLLRQILRPSTSPKSVPVPAEEPPLVLRPPPSEEDIAIQHRFDGSPDRDARREAVVRLLEKRLQEMLGPMGFVLDGKTWWLGVPAGRVYAQIRRFRHGVHATLEVGFVPTPGTKPILINDGVLHMQLPNFVQVDEGSHYNQGNIYYASVDHDPSTLDLPLAVLRDRALPWVLDHSWGAYPDWKAYLERPLRS